MADLATGHSIGRYFLEHELGRGATSIVYLARDAAGQKFAIKVLRLELTASLAVERFLREVHVMTTLDHPAIIPVLDWGNHEGRIYCVMPYMEGGTLRQRLAISRQLPIPEVIRLGTTLAAALHAAHERRLIHRDVKPENILFSGTDPRLGDFGIARALVQASGEQTTSTGIVRGTPAYMSPEQAGGERDLDGRSDIYSLACVLYEALAGVPAFVGATAASLVSQRLSYTPRPVSVYRETVSAELEEVLQRALAISPADRFHTAKEFADALESASRSTMTTADIRAARARSRTRNRTLTMAGLVAAVAASWAGLSASGVRLPWQKAAVDPLDPARIAVLYFDDHSADSSLGYLASGLTENLISELSEVSAIKVVSRNAVKRFRRTALPLDSVGRVLGVGSLVEGSLQQSNGKLRLTVDLVDAKTGFRSDPIRLEHSMGDLFVLEDELAQRVAAELRRRIGAEVRLRKTIQATRSVEARNLVWRADQLRDQAEAFVPGRDTLSMRAAIDLSARADSVLAQATRSDPKWLRPVIDRGWVSLAMARRLPPAQRDSAFNRALGHAGRALAMDERDARALELRGTVRYYQAELASLGAPTITEQLVQARQDLERSVGKDSTLASAWGTLSRVYSATDDMVEAVGSASKALAMDFYLADAPAIVQTLYAASLMIDSLAVARRWCLRGAKEYTADVRFVGCQLTIATEDWSRVPNVKEAERLLTETRRLDPRAGDRSQGWLPAYREMQVAIALARTGSVDSAHAMAQRISSRFSGDTVTQTDLEHEMATLELAGGNRDSALSLLSHYLRHRARARSAVASMPRWTPLRADPRFRALVNEPRTRPR